MRHDAVIRDLGFVIFTRYKKHFDFLKNRLIEYHVKDTERYPDRIQTVAKRLLEGKNYSIISHKNIVAFKINGKRIPFPSEKANKILKKLANGESV